MKNLEELLNDSLYKTLDFPSYSIAETSRLVGISKGRVSRWLNGYEYEYIINNNITKSRIQEAIIEKQPTEFVNASFLDLIDLLFVKRFLDHGFSLQHIRRALLDARNYIKTPHFASSCFFTYGKKIFINLKSIPKEATFLIKLLTGGQQAFPEVIEKISDKIDFEEVTGYGLATRWYPRGKNGHIVLDPTISFGKPTVIGHRLTTANIYDLYMGENKNSDNLSSWFNIPNIQINSAIQFEQSLQI